MLLLLFAVAISSIDGAILPTGPTPVTVCEYNGKFYPMGSFQPSPCEPCQCTSSGRAFCAVVDCFFTPCADAVHDKTKCCPTCPNGPNCKASDGHIIKKGEVYHMDANTVCECDRFSPVARCITKAQVQTVS